MVRGKNLKPFDANGEFCSLGDVGGLARRAVRGAGVTVASGGVGLGIQIVATVVLARLLTPHDFGLLAMVTTVSMLLTNFGVNGITEAVLQRERIDEALASNLFWINVSGGIVLTIGFAAAGSLLARFYGAPQVEDVTAWMSTTIFITSISVLHLALLKRAMRFSVVSANDVLARLISVALSIYLGWIGWGYRALVAGAIVLPLCTTIGAWLLCKWTPSRPRRAEGTASMLWFALHTYGRFTVNYFARNVDNVLVGWRFGTFALGYYKRAYDLFALPASQLGAPLAEVALSALSRLDPRSAIYRRHLVSALSLLAFVGMGLAGVLTLVGRDVIALLLGPAWAKSGQLFVFFGPGIGAMLIYHTHGWIHLSTGRADRWFRWGLVEVAVTVLCFFLALPWGPPGIAIAWTLSFWILTIPALWYAGRPIGFQVVPMLAGTWKYVLAALLAGGASKVAYQAVPFLAGVSGPVAAAERIVMISCLFTVLYLGTVVLLHRGYEPLIQLATLLRAMVPLGISANQGEAASAGTAAVARAEEADSRDTEEPLVSILIPAYNAEEWIGDTIRSAMAQTWGRKEIIVVDDGSSDRTLAIAREFERDGVCVVTQTNQGGSAARNAASALGRGDYIQWLDADDLLAPDKISRQMETLNECPSRRILLSCPFGRFSYRYYRAKFVPTGLWADLSPLEWLSRKMGQNAYMQTATWLVSRELTEAAGPWDTRLLGDDDGEYFCRVLLASDGVRFLPEARVYYRAPFPNTLSYIGQSEKKLRAQWLSMRLHIQYLLGLEDSESTRAACVDFLQAYLISFYPEWTEMVKEMEETARELGGRLEPPRLSWKYSWMLRVFGWGPTKRFRMAVPRVKWTAQRQWDKVLFSLRTRSAGTPMAAAMTGGANPVRTTFDH
jgi:O-antigen/teichoic acid export membrane protein/glycosyltransferase involved in cell wall biosynthesis